jgi:hypothetical protein
MGPRVGERPLLQRSGAAVGRSRRWVTELMSECAVAVDQSGGREIPGRAVGRREPVEVGVHLACLAHHRIDRTLARMDVEDDCQHGLLGAIVVGATRSPKTPSRMAPN